MSHFRSALHAGAYIVMLIATLFFMPIILLYTAFVFRVMRGPVTATSMTRNPNAY